MYGWLVLFNLAVLCTTHTLRFESERPKFEILSDEEIDYVNSLKTTWTAGRNFHPSQAKSVLRKLGAYKEPADSTRVPVKQASFEVDLPDSYDPRDFYPECESLWEIRDQGDCASSWAMAAVSAMSDRTCMFSNGSLSPHLSVQDVVSCCIFCGNGCQGGFPSIAWEYWTGHGIVTGGQYGSNEGCVPYSVEPCDHYVNGQLQPCPNRTFVPTPQCQSQCREGYYRSYSNDKCMGSHFYSMKGEAVMMKDLYLYGPFEAVLEVYSDFLSYKSGVYRYTTGEDLGSVAVKILAWGTENGTPYWLAANAWNRDWGDNGFFKILRGNNECGIELFGNAGIPAGI